MKSLRAFFLGTALLVTALPALADKIVTYTIDPAHSQVRFTWTHAGFSNPGAVFNEVSGTIVGNQDAPEKSTVNVSIPVSSLNSFVPLLNEHLLNSGDYFKTRDFPVITFVSTGMSDIDKTARTFKLQGTLTINGISKPVVLNAKANTVGPHPFYDGAPAAGFDATTTLKRSDYAMGNYVPIVSDELAVNITVEAVESVMYAKKQALWKKAATK
jgi:polyisoprenoid-binding protein YceI